MSRKVLTIYVLISLVMISAAPLARAVPHRGEITVVDARGETVEFDSPPDEIISFMASNTEMLFYLGVGDRVVGVDDYSDYPPEVQELPRVGGAYNVDYDKIVNISADVVVITKVNQKMIEPLKNYDQKVLVTHSDTVDNIYEDLRILGKMCGIDEEAEEKVAELKNDMRDATENTENLPYSERPDLLFITDTYQGIWTTGNDTFQNTLLTRAGYDNIASEKTGWKTIDEETIINKDPEVIIAVNTTRDYVLDVIKKDTWKSITAVQEGNIYFIDGDIISRPGPRIVDAERRLVNITAQLRDIEDTSSEEGYVPSPAGAAMVVLMISAALFYKKRR